MVYIRRKFIFKLNSKVSDKQKKIIIEKVMNDDELNALTVSEIKTILWDYTKENGMNMRNYKLISWGVSLWVS